MDNSGHQDNHDAHENKEQKIHNCNMHSKHKQLRTYRKAYVSCCFYLLPAALSAAQAAGI